jgi:hypothetical protein
MARPRTPSSSMILFGGALRELVTAVGEVRSMMQFVALRCTSMIASSLAASFEKSHRQPGCLIINT